MLYNSRDFHIKNFLIKIGTNRISNINFRIKKILATKIPSIQYSKKFKNISLTGNYQELQVSISRRIHPVFIFFDLPSFGLLRYFYQNMLVKHRAEFLTPQNIIM